MHMPDQATINLINEAKAANATQFDLSPPAVADLAAHGVSPAVIAAMRQPPAPVPPSATGPSIPAPLRTNGVKPLTPQTYEAAKATGAASSNLRVLDPNGEDGCWATRPPRRHQEGPGGRILPVSHQAHQGQRVHGHAARGAGICRTRGSASHMKQDDCHGQCSRDS